MAHMRCPECDKKFTLRDDMAGKKLRCPCGARFRVPAAGPATPPHPACPHCHQAVEPAWKACPACGQRLPAAASPPAAAPPGVPRPVATAIRAGDASVVKATVNHAATFHVAGDVALPAGPPAGGPLIHTGGESVVRAEIDASQNMSAAGDVVHHKEVHATHHETHVHQHESPVGALVRGLGRAVDPLRALREQEEQLRLEGEQAVQTDGAAFAFVAKQLAAIESLAHADALTQARYTACMQTLEVVEQRNSGRPSVHDRVDRLRERLRESVQSHTRQRRLLLAGLVAMPVALLGMMGVAAAFVLRGDERVRQDVQRLIQEGKFSEARVRAQSLSGEADVKRMIESIDRAEQARKSPDKAGKQQP